MRSLNKVTLLGNVGSDPKFITKVDVEGELKSRSHDKDGRNTIQPKSLSAKCRCLAATGGNG